MFKNVATKIALFAFDITTGAAKTGDAGNLTAYVSKDYGAVTVLGDTSATEMDATNAKGWYLFDVAQAESNADALLFTGKSSTSNISVVGQYIHTTPNLFSSLVIDSSGLADANAVKIGPSGSGTAQTAGDVFARIGAPAGASIAADIAAVKVDTAAVKVQTDKLTFSVANQIDANVIDWKGATAPAMTGDAFARLGAPAGASVSADVAAIQADTDDIQTRIPAALVSGRIDASVGAMAADVITAAATAADFTTEVTAGLSTIDAAGVRTAVGLGSANLDTQLGAIAGYIDTEVGAIYSRIGAPAGASIAADIAALPTAAAVADLPTNAELATALGTADDATLAAIAALTIPTAVENADALLDRDMSTGVDSGSPTVRTARQALRFLRNKWTITGTTLSVKAEDDTTESWSSEVTATAGADPITGNDPA